MTLTPTRVVETSLTTGILRISFRQIIWFHECMSLLHSSLFQFYIMLWRTTRKTLRVGMFGKMLRSVLHHTVSIAVCVSSLNWSCCQLVTLAAKICNSKTWSVCDICPQCIALSTQRSKLVKINRAWPGHTVGWQILPILSHLFSFFIKFFLRLTKIYCPLPTTKGTKYWSISTTDLP